MRVGFRLRVFRLVLLWAPLLGVLAGCAEGLGTSAACLTSSGSRAANHRIRNGSCVSQEEYVHVGRITLLTSPTSAFLCTGTLISSTAVLTAAHCLRGDDPLNPPPITSVTVEFPARDLAINATAYRYNPGYTGGDLETTPDLAVLYLASPADSITPVTLRSAALAQGAEVRALGYGYDGQGTDGDGTVGTLLIGALLIDIAGSGGQNIVASSKIKPYTDPLSTETCAGDSGGGIFPVGSPLEIEGVLTGGEYYGTPNCINSKNSIYTAVPVHRAWIEQAVTDGPAGAIAL